MPSRYSEIKEKNFIKTVYYNRHDDADLIEWIQRQENANDAVRQALRQYVHHSPPWQGEGQTLSNGGKTGQTAAIDPAQLRAVVEEVITEQLGQIRAIVQAAIDTALAGRVLTLGDAAPAAPSTNPNGRAASVLDRLALAFDEED